MNAPVADSFVDWMEYFFIEYQHNHNINLYTIFLNCDSLFINKSRHFYVWVCAMMCSSPSQNAHQHDIHFPTYPHLTNTLNWIESGHEKISGCGCWNALVPSMKWDIHSMIIIYGHLVHIFFCKWWNPLSMRFAWLHKFARSQSSVPSVRSFFPLFFLYGSN